MLSSKFLLTKLPVLIGVACILGATGCEKKKTAAEVQKEKVDAFRKHQKIEAIKAYTDLINKYPESDHVAEAKAKLQALGPMPATPTPVKKK